MIAREWFDAEVCWEMRTGDARESVMCDVYVYCARCPNRPAGPRFLHSAISRVAFRTVPSRFNQLDPQKSAKKKKTRRVQYEILQSERLQEPIKRAYHCILAV